MKKNLSCALIGLALLVIGFACGRSFQDAKSGYHYEVVATKDFPSSFGMVRWVHAAESVGLKLFDPGTTSLEFEGRTIYKAKRYPQENTPVAKDVTIYPDRIVWNDGELNFDLKLSRMASDQP